MTKLIRIALCVCLLAVAVAAQAEDLTEYYVVRADGQKIGRLIHSRSVAGDKVTTVDSMEIAVGRGGVSMTIAQDEKCVETADGKPLTFECTQVMAGIKQVQKGTIADGKIDLVTIAGAQQQKSVVPYPAGALMAEGVRLAQESKGLAEGTKYTLAAFVPSMMDAMTAEVSVGATRKVDLLGRVVTLTEVTTTFQNPTGQMVATSYVDETLNALKTVMPMLGMSLEIIACDKSVALADNAMVDLLDKMLLDSPVPIDEKAAAIVYLLEPIGKQALAGFIATDSQAVQTTPGGALQLTVRSVKPAAGVKFPYTGSDATALEALKPNRYIESDDEKVIALARQAVGDAGDAADAVKRIEKFVGEYISEKSLSIGYASAAEVVASREGDCSEHAVLAAALCRAVGIPARVVAGYVYVPQLGQRSNVFGGHAWTEAMIDGRWIGLDAAQGSFGVGHIAQAVGNGEPSDFFRALSTMGNFKIANVTVEE